MDNISDKKSFVLYCDYADHVSLLTDEDAGKLFKTIFSYVRNGEVEQLSPIASMAFSFIRSQLDRDQSKWEEIRTKRADAGRKGGLAKRKQITVKEANAISEKHNETIEAVNEYESVDVTENASVNVNGYVKKHTYGEYQKVELTDDEYVKLSADYGEILRDKAIKYLDEYIMEKGYNSNSHNIAIRRWVINAVKEQEAKNQRQVNNTAYKKQNVADQLEDFYSMAADWAKE